MGLPWHLNIRQKVILGLSIGIVAIALIGAISYHYLGVIELKLDFVEIADDLRNITLELRRYEKNYLLYGSAEDFKENQHYIQLGLTILGKLDPDVRMLEGSSQVNQLRQEFLRYQKLMKQISSAGEGKPRSHEVEEQLRERGKQLVELSHQLAAFERQKILKIIQRLKTQLLSAIGIFVVLGGFLVFIVSRKILQPLRIIEKTTHRIAMGNFTPLPVLDTRDETQRVVEAFNRMVQELERRQDQLLQAKKLSSLGVLTSGVAHQLNNPLNNISTSCQILLEELDTQNLELFRKMLTNVEQEVDRARDIVKGLLEFARARDFTLKATPLKAVVERTLRLISSQVPVGIEIVEQVPDDLVLDLDVQRMQEALLNLLMNGIQAIDNQSGQIRVEARTDQAKQQAVITVADTGMGISKNDLGRIFDPFFTTKDVGGTGLGLSIVYGIIQKHRGTITAESTEGAGTRFIIRLPLQAAAAEGRGAS